MSFSEERRELAAELIARFPRPRSALIPLLHLAQEQDRYLTDEAMREIAELVGATPAEVEGTAGFYEMFRFEKFAPGSENTQGSDGDRDQRAPVGRYLVNVCTNISCLISGGRELLEHAERSLGVAVGGTTGDGLFTLEEVECIAACTEAPCLQVNYRYRYLVSPEEFDSLVNGLRSGRLSSEIPDHGTLATVRQSIPPERSAGIVAPEQAREAPVWLSRNDSGAAV